MPNIPTANARNAVTDSSNSGPNTNITIVPEQHELKHIKVYVTGYGPFRGITENPSGQISISFLPETTIYIHLSPHVTLKITIHPHPTPVRVAYADVDQTITEIYTTESFDYILHLGVGLAGGFELEKIAHGDGYNMGDVDGLVPGGDKAKSDHELKKEGLLRHWGGGGDTGPKQVGWMGTGLDVDWIVKMVLNGKIKLSEFEGGGECRYTATVNEEREVENVKAAKKSSKKPLVPKGYKIRPSKDAGRYLCEYIFRKSLEQAISRRKKGARKPWNWNHDAPPEVVPVRNGHEEDNISKRVLFMHVPPVGNLYTVAEGIECLKQVVVGMVLDGEGLRKH